MSDLTDLEKTRIEMKAIVPLIRTFQNVFGTDEVTEALKRHNKEQENKAKSRKVTPADFSYWPKQLEKFTKENGQEFEVLVNEENAFEFNITKCMHFEMMKELDAVDIAPHLICNRDFAASYDYGTELTRTQTCMEGAEYCDFKYKIRKDL